MQNGVYENAVRRVGNEMHIKRRKAATSSGHGEKADHNRYQRRRRKECARDVRAELHVLKTSTRRQVLEAPSLVADCCQCGGGDQSYVGTECLRMEKRERKSVMLTGVLIVMLTPAEKSSRQRSWQRQGVHVDIETARGMLTHTERPHDPAWKGCMCCVRHE